MILEQLNQAKTAIQSQSSLKPLIAITLGSGLGAFVDEVDTEVIIPYNEIPHFSGTTVLGHKGQLVLGKIDQTPIAVLQGRIHGYEGHTPAEVVFPTRLMKMLGAENIILTNASGGINLDYKPGDLVMITDHLNLTSANPLTGPNVEEFGPRFPDMTYTYSPSLQETMAMAARDISYNLKKGIYAGLTGPTYETPAEIRMLRTLGADLVGMSTVHEAIAAHHIGLKVAGISCVSNMAAGILKEELKHEDIKEQANKAMVPFVKILVETIKKLGQA
jgi:purine-nucleoside phosphorylase